MHPIEDAEHDAEEGAAAVERSRPFRILARTGFAASGLIQLLVGVIAIRIAFHAGGRGDQSGALADLADAPGGVVLLLLVAIGSVALTVWLLAVAILEREQDLRRRWLARARDLGKAVIYGIVGVTALRVVFGDRSSSAASTKQGAETLLHVPGGAVVLAIAGAVVLAIGGSLVWIGLARRFEKLLVMPAEPADAVIAVLGTIGYVARGLAVAVVGVLFIVAAATSDARRASGLDGALREFAALPFGQIVLIAIGAGWIASGLFGFVRARLARMR